MKKVNANTEIKKAMRDNERAVVAHARKYGSISYDRCGLSWMKAIDRVVVNGKLKYSPKAMAYVVA